MKTEDFDDAIRRKLKSIQPAYNETEVDRIHNYVSTNTPVSFMAKFGKIVLISAAGIVVTGLIILNLIQLQKHDKLVEKIDTLEKRQEILLKNIPDTNSESSLATKQGKNNEERKETVAENADKNNAYQATNETRTETTAKSNISVKNTLATTNNFTQKTSLKSKPYFQNKPGIINIKKEKEEVVENALKPKSNIENNKLTENAVKLNNSAEKANQVPEIHEMPKDSNNIIADSQIKIDSLINDSGSIAEAKKKNIPHLDLQKENNKKSIFSKLQFSIGLSAEKANQLIGFGIPVQIAFSDNWSIYSGLKMTRITDAKYRDEREFRAREGKELRTEYGSATPDSAFILNIERTKKLIQLPLALAYNIPLKNDFSLLASVGTDFNLAAFHSIDYDYRHRNNMVVSKEIENVRKPVPFFNNANVAFGLQKRWDDFILQANPYLMYHFRKVPVKSNIPNSALVPGINIRLMYNF